jgi:hypothetical protein
MRDRGMQGKEGLRAGLRGVKSVPLHMQGLALPGTRRLPCHAHNNLKQFNIILIIYVAESSAYIGLEINKRQRAQSTNAAQQSAPA